MRLIDADALINRVVFHTDWPSDEKEAFEDEVNSEPTVEPERKTGKWIHVDDAYNRISGRCSICGWEAHLYEDDVVGMDYCPNCGARLEGDSDEDDKQ